MTSEPRRAPATRDAGYRIRRHHDEPPVPFPPAIVAAARVLGGRRRLEVGCGTRLWPLSIGVQVFRHGDRATLPARARALHRRVDAAGTVRAGEMTGRRIAIVGAGGAGKTVLANRLGAVLGLPVTHLDALRYDADWNVVPEAEFVAAQRAVTATGRWIIEGNSLASMPVRFAAADMIVFLDLSPVVCLWGIARRRMRYRGGRHADGVHDRITWSFLRYVLLFRRRHAPAIRRRIAEHGSHAVMLEVTSRRQANRLLATLIRIGGRTTTGGTRPDHVHGQGDIGHRDTPPHRAVPPPTQPQPPVHDRR